MTALKDLLKDPTKVISLIVELEARNKTTNIVETFRYQTANRGKCDDAYPAYVKSVGSRDDTLEADELSSIAKHNLGVVELYNTPVEVGGVPPLNEFYDNYSLSGRRLTVYGGAGKQSDGTLAEPFANYEPVSSSIMDGEPEFGSGIIQIIRKSVLDELKVDLDVKSYVGEPGSLKILTSSAQATAPNNVVHHLTEFTLAGRFLHPGAGANFAFLMERRTGTTPENWAIFFRRSIDPIPGRIVARYSSGGVGGALQLTSAMSYTDGEVHWWVFARRSGHAYLMVDGAIVAESTSPPVPDLPVAGVEMGDAFEEGPGWINDNRIYNHYISPDEMRAAMAVRANGDEQGLVGLWRYNDVSGSTVTDHSSTGAHATISGTEGVDYEWISSDLGTPELTGRSYPVLLGGVFNAETDLVNVTLDRYRARDRTIGSVASTPLGVVREGGEELNSATDHNWDDNSWKNPVFELTSPALNPVTAEQTIHSNYRPEDIIPEILETRGPLDSSGYDLTGFGAIYQASLGLHTRRRPISNIISEILEGGLGHLRSKLDGTIALDVLVPPTSPSPRDGACLEIISSRDNQAGVEWSGLANPISSANFTVAAWIKTHRLGPAIDSIFSSTVVLGTKDGSASNKIVISFDLSSGIPRLVLENPSVATIRASFPQIQTVDNDWFFIAITHDLTNSRTRFYGAKQGESLVLLQTVNSIAYISAPVSADIFVGPNNSVSGKTGLYGSTFEPQIYNTVLSLAQLQAFMNTPPTAATPNLAFYSPLDGESSTSLTDVVSSTVATTLGEVREVPDLTVDITNNPRSLHYKKVIPAHRIQIGYRRNFSPIDQANILATVSQEDSLDLRTPERFETWNNPEIDEDHLYSREIEVSSLFSDRIGAQAAMKIARYRLHPDRVIGSISGLGRESILLTINKELKVIGSELSPDEPITFRVIRSQPDLDQLMSNQGLWR